jgi:aspartyl-tRNA(Asn)/glutamyl-tRNA(Gln) amidotransferase subunit C|tara:strand:- start:795 stop:1082 length:288 start_codon:yes stop_codon:yes gene_type:complete
MSDFDIKNIAKLASIKLSTDEEEKLTSDLSIIIEHVQALSSLELDTNIEDVFIHPLEKELKLVEDIENDSLTHDEALSNAPESKNGRFVVPPSME